MVARLALQLYEITEDIAEKEIEKDPIDFIRREANFASDNSAFLSKSPSNQKINESEDYESQ